jgi:hypothetical protein
MKFKLIIQKIIHTGRIIQLFGEAKLVQHANGQYELVGGTRADLTAAKEWISMFGHEIVLNKSTNTRRPALATRN